MKAYIAGPLFNDAEKAFNLKVDALVQSLGIQTYLPQRDGGESIRMIREGQPPELVRRRLFELDVSRSSSLRSFHLHSRRQSSRRGYMCRTRHGLYPRERMYRVSDR